MIGHMNCARSLTLLSDYHDGLLSEDECALVRAHLDCCTPCLGVFTDLQLIIVTSVELRNGNTINFPDEAVMWHQFKIAAYESH